MGFKILFVLFSYLFVMILIVYIGWTRLDPTSSYMPSQSVTTGPGSNGFFVLGLFTIITFIHRNQQLSLYPQWQNFDLNLTSVTQASN